MKKIIVLLTGVAIFIINVAFGVNCVATKNPLHTHDTDNVGHQFYDALIDTPKDAISKGTHATKDLMYATVELVLGTPIKTLGAIKNGTLKALLKTKDGIVKGYQFMIKKPIVATKDVIGKAAQRVKNAGHVLIHPEHEPHEEHDETEQIVATYDDIYVLVTEKTISNPTHEKVQDDVCSLQKFLRVTIVPSLFIQHWLDHEGYVSVPVKSTQFLDNSNECNFLTEETLLLLTQSYQQIATDAANA